MGCSDSFRLRFKRWPFAATIMALLIIAEPFSASAQFSIRWEWLFETLMPCHCGEEPPPNDVTPRPTPRPIGGGKEEQPVRRELAPQQP